MNFNTGKTGSFSHGKGLVSFDVGLQEVIELNSDGAMVIELKDEDDNTTPSNPSRTTSDTTPPRSSLITHLQNF